MRELPLSREQTAFDQLSVYNSNLNLTSCSSCTVQHNFRNPELFAFVTPFLAIVRCPTSRTGSLVLSVNIFK